MANNNYGQNTMTRLKDEEQVRQRPAVIFGTNDEKGAAHGVYEVIANAIDEHREGFGNLININIFKNGVHEVEDRGRGIPMGWNEDEQMFNWDLAFCTLYASGKYDSESYGESLGLNGLGLTAMQYASEFMEAYSTRDGKTSIMKFAKGKPASKLEVKDTPGKENGTLIKFKPDPDVFMGIKETVMPPDYYINILRRQAMLHPGLKIILNHEELGQPVEMYYPEGLKDFIDLINEKPLLSKTIEVNGEATGTDDGEKYPEKYTAKMRLAFNFSREASLLELYHNGSHLYEGGVTMDALKTGFVKAFEDYGKENGKLTKSERFNFRDIESILIAVADTNAPGHRTFFKNQTKGAINNPFIKYVFNDFIYYQVKTWLETDKQSERVFNEVLTNKTAREEADKVGKKVIQAMSKAVTFANKPENFADCDSKTSVISKEIYIVEGKSAMGATKQARDSDFQAILAVRGKILNALKAPLTRVLVNQIVQDILRVLGCGIEVESEYLEDLPKFDINKLNYGKVIICTDADLDGQHIRCLILTVIYRLMPSLLKAGKVYIAETPLFEIEVGDEAHFAYNDAEKDKILAKLKADGVNEKRIKVNRSKGLGENDPEMMSVSTMHPLTRRLVPIKYPEDDSNLDSYFQALLGDDIETRRLLIEQYFTLTEVDID